MRLSDKDTKQQQQYFLNCAIMKYEQVGTFGNTKTSTLCENGFLCTKDVHKWVAGDAGMAISAVHGIKEIEMDVHKTLEYFSFRI